MKLCLLFFFVIITSSFRIDKLITKKGFLFFIDNQLEGFFIESKDSILSDKIFSNDSYMVIERLCTRSPNIDNFRNSSIGQKIKFDYIIAYGVGIH